ncbi:MAG: RNA polymerase sigma factor, partial [Limisphaerales bacterium]
MSAGLLTEELADEQLWRLSLKGDREAFGRIVGRYQALICSLAYSGCGSLQESEDLAQEVFVTAWKRLAELRDPQKLRQWLCGIARHRVADVVRREVRRGGRPASLESLCESAEAASEKSDPAEEAVSREEEMLLWRALGGMPETYREPMVLFYREQQSVSEVAEKLELTEEAVRQRLSRGRAMLRGEMETVVESTLRRTAPGSAFTVGVLVALPIAASSTASAALVGTATKAAAGAAGKGLLAKLGAGAVIGPLIGLFFAYLGTKAAAASARSEEERKCILMYARWRIIPFCFLMSIGLAGILTQAGKWYVPSAAWLVAGISVWTAALVFGILWMCRLMDRAVARIRCETKTTDADY